MASDILSRPCPRFGKGKRLRRSHQKSLFGLEEPERLVQVSRDAGQPSMPVVLNN